MPLCENHGPYSGSICNVCEEFRVEKLIKAGPIRAVPPALTSWKDLAWIRVTGIEGTLSESHWLHQNCNHRSNAPCLRTVLLDVALTKGEGSWVTHFSLLSYVLVLCHDEVHNSPVLFLEGNRYRFTRDAHTQLYRAEEVRI